MFYKIITVVLISFVLLFAYVPAEAQLGQALPNLRTSLKGTGLQGGTDQSLSDIIGDIVKAALALVGSIFLLLTIYAGILWMTAAGKEEQVETATKIIKTTVIGLFITMAAYAITFFVAGRLSTSAGGGGDGAPGLGADGPWKEKCSGTTYQQSTLVCTSKNDCESHKGQVLGEAKDCGKLCCWGYTN